MIFKKSPIRDDTPGITFLGVSHIDPDGYVRLITALEELRAEVILLEVSPFSLLFRSTIGRLYLSIFKHRLKAMNITPSAELSIAGKYLSIPWEYHASKDWARRWGAKIILIDVSRFSFLRLLRAHELITRKNIKILSEISTDRLGEERRIAGKIFKGDGLLAGIKAAGLAGDPALAEREKILAARTRSAMEKFREKRIVYVGGWEHCIEDVTGRTLYSIIGEGKRKIIFLTT